MQRPPRVLLTIREVAFALGCGRTTVYDLIGSQQLPTVKVGRLTRIPTSAVDDFVTRHLRSPTSSPVPGPSPPVQRTAAGVNVIEHRAAQAMLFDDVVTARVENSLERLALGGVTGSPRNRVNR